LSGRLLMQKRWYGLWEVRHEPRYHRPRLYDRLATSGHLSPFEHVAKAGGGSGNFLGWTQARAGVPREANFLG